MQLNKLVKEYASEIGIDICRITDGNELIKARKILEKRSKGQYWPQPFTNQDLDELTRPDLHFENLNSIIILAVSYNNGAQNKSLSNYITKEDYHNYLKRKMNKLIKKLKVKLRKEFNYKFFVDTAPFLERALAQKAGVGFIGKNTLVINPEYGSYLFLGEIFTDLKIEKDQALDLDCGDCRICIDNCEGGALKAEYFLDADDCISYLTQKKGILTKKEIKKIGKHIWGCDACQSKCPYNQNKKLITKKELQFLEKDLEYFLKLDRKSVPIELKNTAMFWRGSRILIRNALIVAANSKNNKYFNLIKEKLDDNSPIIRYYAAYALLKIDFKKAVNPVKKILAEENNKEYKTKIEKLLLKVIR